jgi:hypothetical protein
MKASLDMDEVSSPPAQTAVWSVKIGAAYGDGPEKRRLGIPSLLANSCDGDNIVETTSKTQFDAMNNRSNGKSRIRNLGSICLTDAVSGYCC